MMKSFLKFLFVMQEVDNQLRKKNGLKPLGKGFFKAYRLNPYNPLSYVTVVIVAAIGILLFGLIGIWKETGRHNPFKWN